MTTIIDGKVLAKKITDNLKTEIAKFDKKPNLTVILVGNNPSSQIYVKNKQKKAQELNIKSNLIIFDETVDEKTLAEQIQKLNEDTSVNAILVQLPLPKHINSKKIIELISPEKDVDGFTPTNLGKIISGSTPFAYPCTPKGILTIFKEYNIDLTSKHVVITGRSNIVGKPLAQMILNKNATVTVCHSYTKNLEAITKQADILISATGKKLITEKMVKNGAVVIDVGIFKDENAKLSGDVDFNAVKNKTSFITPVPGGIGPMTIASLMSNTFELFKQQNNL